LAEIEPLKNYFSGKEFTIVSPVLKGHTENKSDLWHVTYKDWIISAEQGLIELTKICDKVVIIGFSMGGLIATHLAVKHSPIAMITLCTPIYVWDLKRILINIFLDLRQGQFKNIKRYIRSMNIPIKAILNFKLLLIKTKTMFKEIKCPVFVAQGLLDDTVQFRSAEYIYNNITSNFKEKKYYSKSGHIICLGDDKDELFKDIDKYLTGLQ
jgi:carboxylesterase